MENYSPKAALSVIRIIHLAIMGVPVIFSTVVIFLLSSGQIVPEEEPGFLIYVPVGLLLIAFPVSSTLYRNNLKNNLKPGSPLQAKLSVFQAAHLVRMALFEAAALSAAVVCMLTGQLLVLAVVIITILVSLKYLPSVYLLETEIELTPEEKSLLQ